MAIETPFCIFLYEDYNIFDELDWSKVHKYIWNLKIRFYYIYYYVFFALVGPRFNSISFASNRMLLLL